MNTSSRYLSTLLFGLTLAMTGTEAARAEAVVAEEWGAAVGGGLAVALEPAEPMDAAFNEMLAPPGGGVDQATIDGYAKMEKCRQITVYVKLAPEQREKYTLVDEGGHIFQGEEVRWVVGLLLTKEEGDQGLRIPDCTNAGGDLRLRYSGWLNSDPDSDDEYEAIIDLKIPKGTEAYKTTATATLKKLPALDPNKTYIIH